MNEIPQRTTTHYCTPLIDYVTRANFHSAGKHIFMLKVIRTNLLKRFWHMVKATQQNHVYCLVQEPQETAPRMAAILDFKMAAILDLLCENLLDMY